VFGCIYVCEWSLGRGQPAEEDGLARLRGDAFGAEVQRRILMGTYVLSAQYAAVHMLVPVLWCRRSRCA
jgi:Asp-tRNA(Asn)/Glu-tRNA(Gln) amidotransferase A subunit family amidase